MQALSSIWLKGRHSGVLAHVSSLPGKHGIGNLGPGSRALIDFLARAGFHYWQICPLGPTGYGDSPYQSFSSFAGNPYFIDLDQLIDLGLLTDEECHPLQSLSKERTDYGALHLHFWPIAAKAHARFASRGVSLPGFASFEDFRQENNPWLDTFADFMALKTHFGGRPWMEWPEPFRTWRPGMRPSLPPGVRVEAARYEFLQYLFFAQWSKVRAYAASRGVAIIGDLPIFVSLDSADAWQSRSILRLNAEGKPLAIAGVPPDYFSEFGQCWGNPLYDWDALAKTGFAWWFERLRAALSLYDVLRLDHFRGFDTYWEIPGDSADARHGEWRAGPGLAFFEAFCREVAEPHIIAEDLGYITADVVALRRAAGFPGMRVLQFAYGHDDNNVNLPHFIPEDSVVYTGTHDNDTTRGWLESLPHDVFRKVADYFQLDGKASAWPLIRAAFASAARLAVVPMQDLLDLPGEARMNRPGTAEGNWQWRFTADQLAELASERTATLQGWNKLFDREGDTRQREFSAPPAETHLMGRPVEEPVA